MEHYTSQRGITLSAEIQQRAADAIFVLALKGVSNFTGTYGKQRVYEAQGRVS